MEREVVIEKEDDEEEKEKISSRCLAFGRVIVTE
jgi:hypothetical protein